jgi:hypothetical protein
MRPLYLTLYFLAGRIKPQVCSIFSYKIKAVETTKQNGKGAKKKQTTGKTQVFRLSNVCDRKAKAYQFLKVVREKRGSGGEQRYTGVAARCRWATFGGLGAGFGVTCCWVKAVIAA